MSRKYPAQRRGAFLRYLGETGNVTLAAERAKVSRSWVRLHRSADPAFDEACREALRRARESLGSRKPPDGWAFQEGEELVVNGSNGRRVQVRRAKLSQWTARVERRFLAVLRCTCNVKAACRDVGLWPPSAYAHRQRWPDFARRWDEAIAMGTSELDFRIVQSLRRFFDPEIPGPEEPAGGVTVSDAIRYLERHRPKRGQDGRG